jgi:hypothetical protein
MVEEYIRSVGLWWWWIKKTIQILDMFRTNISKHLPVWAATYSRIQQLYVAARTGRSVLTFVLNVGGYIAERTKRHHIPEDKKLIYIYNIRYKIYYIYIRDWLLARRQGVWVRGPGRVKNFHFSISSRPAQGSIQPGIQLEPRTLSLRVKR